MTDKKKSTKPEIIFKSTKELVNAQIGFIEKREKEAKEFAKFREGRLNPRPLSGIPTGFSDIDIITDGLPYGISLVGARPEDGLTDFGLNIANNVSRTHKVAYISPDIPAKVLVKRLLSCESMVNMRSMNEGVLSEADFPKLTIAAHRFSFGDNLTFYDKKGINPWEFSEACKYMQKDQGTQLVILDRFQGLFPRGESTGESYYWKAREIAGLMHDLVSESGLALMLLSEVKKKKKSERITTDHLRDFGVFEYDARPIILLEDDGRSEEDSPDPEARNMIARITNNLGGELYSNTNLTYLRSWGRFESASKVSEEDI